MQKNNSQFQPIFFSSWNIKNSQEKPIFNILLEERNLFTQESQDAYFSCDIKNMNSPHQLKDIKKSVQRIKKAIENQEKIIVFGDYDVDGVVGTTILVDLLRKLNAKVSYRIPHRKDDGYGLKKYFVEEIAAAGVTLLITVDNGITSVEEVALAQSLGIDVILTDHHIVHQTVPAAFAVVNPKQEDCNYACTEICGAAVSYKLSLALAEEMLSAEEVEEFRISRLDLVALATVADCMPLVDENRVFVKQGLEVLKNTQNKGLKALADLIGIDLQSANSDTFGFQIGPRINAAGRMKHAYFALQMLLGNTEHAQILENLNVERKGLVITALKESEKNLASTAIFIQSSPDWHTGIIGLIAGRLTEKYHLPSIILEEQENRCVASCRAPEGFNLFAFLSEFKDYFDHFGGHEQAAGFSMKKEYLAEFKQKAEMYAKKILAEKPLEKILHISKELDLQELKLETLLEIEKFAPFGIGNLAPVFLLKNVNIQWSVMGKEQQFLQGKIMLPDSSTIRLHRFADGDKVAEFNQFQKQSVAVRLQKNVWQGQESLQLEVVDIAGM